MADIELVQVPARVFERYRALATAVDGFVNTPEVQAAFRRGYTDPKTGAPMWTLYGDLANMLDALNRACDEADKALGRKEERS